MPIATVRWLVLLVCIAGCRDYAALGRGDVELGSDGAVAGDLAAMVDMTPAALDQGPHCGQPPVDFAGAVMASGGFGASLEITAAMTPPATLSNVRAGPFSKDTPGLLAYAPSDRTTLVYEMPNQGGTWTATDLTNAIPGRTPTNALTADTDGSGLMSVLLFYADEIGIVHPNGSSTSATSIMTASMPMAAVVGNFRGSIDKDLLVLENGVLEQFELSQGYPPLGMIVLDPADPPMTWAVLDEDGDCLDDLLYVTQTTQMGYILRGSTSSVMSVAAYAPINGASKLGRAELHGSADGVYVMTDSGVTLLLHSAIAATQPIANPVLFTTGDLTNDGLSDFITWDGSGNAAGYHLENAGDTYDFVQDTITGVNPVDVSSPVITSINGDDYPDLAFAGSGTMAALPRYSLGLAQ